MNAALEAPSTAALFGREIAGRYLIFGLGPESYGIPVLHVLEIVQTPEVTSLPQMAASMQGVFSLRGRIIPVIDLRRRRRLGLPTGGLDEPTCVVVVQTASAAQAPLEMGLVVDRIEEVMDVDPKEIEAPSQLGALLTAANLFGMAKIRGKSKAPLDIDKAVAANGPASIPRAGD